MPWRMSGKLLEDANGNIIRCNVCPCVTSAGGLGPPCCPGSVPQPIWMWLSLAQRSTPPLLDIDGNPICVAGTGRNFILGLPGGSMIWNSAFVQNVVTAAGCTRVRLRGRCDPGGDTRYNADWSVDYNYGFIDSTQINPGPGGPCAFPNQCQLDSDSSGHQVPFVGSFFDYDPSTGIKCPDGNIIATTKTFSISYSIAGIPHMYSCPIVYCPGADIVGFNPDGNLFKRYQWLGVFQDCTGAFIRVMLQQYGTGGLSAACPATSLKWWMVCTDGAGIRLLYDAAPFPTIGFATATVVGGALSGCDDGVSPIPWSVT